MWLWQMLSDPLLRPNVGGTGMSEMGESGMTALKRLREVSGHSLSAFDAAATRPKLVVPLGCCRSQKQTVVHGGGESRFDGGRPGGISVQEGHFRRSVQLYVSGSRRT